MSKKSLFKDYPPLPYTKHVSFVDSPKRVSFSSSPRKPADVSILYEQLEKELEAEDADMDRHEREFQRRREILNRQRNLRRNELNETETDQPTKPPSIIVTNEAGEAKKKLFVPTSPKRLIGKNTRYNQTNLENAHLQKTLIVQSKATKELKVEKKKLENKYDSEIQNRVQLACEVTALQHALADEKRAHEEAKKNLNYAQGERNEIEGELRNLYNDAVTKIEELECLYETAKTDHSSAMQEQWKKAKDESMRAKQDIKLAEAKVSKLENEMEIAQKRGEILKNELEQQKILLLQSKARADEECMKRIDRDEQIKSMRMEMEILQRKCGDLGQTVEMQRFDNEQLRDKVHNMQRYDADEKNEKQRLLLNNHVLLKEKKERVAQIQALTKEVEENTNIVQIAQDAANDVRGTNERLEVELTLFRQREQKMKKFVAFFVWQRRSLQNQLKQVTADLENNVESRKNERRVHLTCFLSYRVKTTLKTKFLHWRIQTMHAKHRQKALKMVVTNKDRNDKIMAFQAWQQRMHVIQEEAVKTLQTDLEESEKKVMKYTKESLHEKFTILRRMKKKRLFGHWHCLLRALDRGRVEHALRRYEDTSITYEKELTICQDEMEQMKVNFMTILEEERHEKDLLQKELERISTKEKYYASKLKKEQKRSHEAEQKYHMDKEKAAKEKFEEEKRLEEEEMRRLCDEKVQAVKRRTQRIRESCQSTSNSMRQANVSMNMSRLDHSNFMLLSDISESDD